MLYRIREPRAPEAAGSGGRRDTDEVLAAPRPGQSARLANSDRPMPGHSLPEQGAQDEPEADVRHNRCQAEQEDYQVMLAYPAKACPPPAPHYPLPE